MPDREPDGALNPGTDRPEPSVDAPDGTATEASADGVQRGEADLRRYDTVEELLRDKLSEAMGGWRGVVESALPILGFTIAWTVSSNLRTSLLVSGGAVAVLLIVRLLQRQDPRFVAFAAVGVGISAFFALRSGKAEDAFLPGILQNAAGLVLVLTTNLLRWPLYGFLVGAAEIQAFMQDPTWWRKHAGIVRVAVRLGWVLVGLYVVRLGIMLPLYFTEQVGALGVAKVVLGAPAFLLAAMGMIALLVRGRTPIDADRAA